MPKSRVKQGLQKYDLDLLCQQVCRELPEPQQNLFLLQKAEKHVLANV